MREIINTLQSVDGGEFRGIGGKMVALGNEVAVPEGLDIPKRDSGFGFVGRYLGSAALDIAQEANLKLFSPAENGKVVDARLLAWLLIGRQSGRPGLDTEQFIPTAIGILDKAVRATTAISKLEVVQGGKKSATNWRSIFEGTVKAGIFGKDFQPTIITSLGGYTGDVPLAAPFNVLPGLEVAQTLREEGFDPRMIVTSAAKYGADCNGLDLDAASNNWNLTFGAYQKLVKEFYPVAESTTVYETLWPGGIDIYPEPLVDAARECCNEDQSLRATAEQYGAGTEAFVKYMLSHTQAFRDYQTSPEAPFVIKVGAPSELRFSRWQKLVMEKALSKVDGFVPNTALVNRDGKAEYGQISLYYPRLGNRPPYYPDSELAEYPEPTIGGNFPQNYWDFLYSIPENNPSLVRYDDLRKALEQTRVKPDEYLKMFAGGLK